MCYNLTDTNSPRKIILREKDMSQLVKNKKNIAALVASAVTVLCFVILSALWLLLSSPENIVFDMPGGDLVSVEYGHEYRHDVTARAVLPLIGLELHIEARPNANVDVHTLGSHGLSYTASFLGRSRTAERIVQVVDTTAPEIILRTKPGYEADWLEGYIEEGYSAEDLCEGDLSHMVTIKHLDGVIEYTVTDSSGNVERAVREINYVNRPVITLNGGDQIISPRPYYSDPGGTAFDAAGNDYSALVRVSGEVDSRHAGDYELTYSISNSAGDTVSAKRIVTVQAEPCPAVCMPEEKTIYLSFDDGPGPYTDMLLDVLDSYGVKATFFVTGNGGRYNSCIRRAFDAGHSIGVHTYSHNYGYIYSSEDNFFNDFNAVQQLIYEQTGQYSQLFRFPGGSSNTVSRFNYGVISRLSAELEDMGYRYFDWNVNSRDAEGVSSSAAIAANIINGCAGKHCSVVLQHDIKQGSVYAVEAVIRWGLENGYSFKPLTLSSPDVHQNIAN